jgi:hypothetical protein
MTAQIARTRRQQDPEAAGRYFRDLRSQARTLVRRDAHGDFDQVAVDPHVVGGGNAERNGDGFTRALGRDPRQETRLGPERHFGRAVFRVQHQTGRRSEVTRLSQHGKPRRRRTPEKVRQAGVVLRKVLPQPCRPLLGRALGQDLVQPREDADVPRLEPGQHPVEELGRPGNFRGIFLPT